MVSHERLSVMSSSSSTSRVPQDCFSRIPLLAHDPDGDHVKCSVAPNATVPANVSLDEVFENQVSHSC